MEEELSTYFLKEVKVMITKKNNQRTSQRPHTCTSGGDFIEGEYTEETSADDVMIASVEDWGPVSQEIRTYRESWRTWMDAWNDMVGISVVRARKKKMKMMLMS